MAEILQGYGLDPSECVLKYHDGNKQYPAPEGAEAVFGALDTSMSKIRVVLLVQIGKEGWDCRSLTGVILAQQGDCPKNMVLQTCCRCLRQVERGHYEDAVIWLNKYNADKEAPWHSDAEIKIDRLGYVIENGKKTTHFWDGAIRSDRKPLRLKIRNICGDESVCFL